MSFWTNLATTVGTAYGGPIGGFIANTLASKAQNPVQGPLTQQQQKNQNTLGALSSAVFQTYSDNKNNKTDISNQNAVYAAQTANDNSVYAAQTANDQALSNQGTDLLKLRNKAEEAGFNPLTVLRATGGQGFNNDVMLSAPSLIAPQISSANFWGSFTNNYQTSLQNKANLQNTYANTAYTGILSKNSLSQASQYGSQMDAINAWGNKIEASNVSDAEEWERRYGDLLGSVIGIPIAISDGLKALNKTAYDKMQKMTPKGQKVFLPTYQGDVPAGQITTTPLWTLGQLSEAAMKVLKPNISVSINPLN
jgi:hypothetical protein